MYPILNDLVGFGSPAGHLDGQSLKELVFSPGGKWKNGRPVACMAIKDEPNSPAEVSPPHFSVVSSRYRYTLCYNGEEELYDHEKDPNEWVNLAGKSKYNSTQKELKQQLLGILKNTAVPEAYKKFLKNN